MKKRKGGGGAYWMDTYGDMVTLLLCFFVLLYSMSTIDANKWLILVQSFNPSAIPTQTKIDGNDGPSADEPTGDSLEIQQQQIEQDIEELYEKIKAYVAEQGNESTIEVNRGAGGEVYLNFNEAIFFDPNSYYLREDGEKILSDVGQIISEVRDSIDELAVIGHTAQAEPGKPNDVDKDRFLASNRATIVEIYLQKDGVVPPERIVSMERGQWRPVASNDTPEGRAQNRRVEIVVTGRDLKSELGDSVQEYYAQRDIENPLADENAPTETPAPVVTPAQSGAPEASDSSEAPGSPGPAESSVPAASSAPEASSAPTMSPAVQETPQQQIQSPAPGGTSD